MHFCECKLVGTIGRCWLELHSWQYKETISRQQSAIGGFVSFPFLCADPCCRSNMASTTEGGTLHRVKHAGQAPWRKNSSGAVSSSSSSSSASSIENRINSHTMAQADALDDRPPPPVVSDILPPAGGVYQSPYVETPVPIPVPMWTSNSTTGPALKRKALATSDKILQAQRDWEKRTLPENRGEQPCSVHDLSPCVLFVLAGRAQGRM